MWLVVKDCNIKRWGGSVGMTRTRACIGGNLNNTTTFHAYSPAFLTYLFVGVSAMLTSG